MLKLVSHVSTPRLTSVVAHSGMRPWMRSRVTRRTADVEPALRPANIVGGRRLAHPIPGLAPQLSPALPTDALRERTRHPAAEAKARSAPSVGGLGGAHQGRAQLPQFRRARTFV